MTPEQELDLRMEEPEKGSVILMGVAYPGGPKTYRYAALEVNGLWYLSGSGYGGTGCTWNVLIDWLKSRGAEVVYIRRATEWETL